MVLVEVDKLFISFSSTLDAWILPFGSEAQQ